MPECQACQTEDQVQRHVQRAAAPEAHAEAPAALPGPGQMLAVLGQVHRGGRGNGPVRTAALQQMQQTHGNRAVQRFLAGQAAPTAVQRCGGTPCNCSAEEQAQHAAG